MKRLSFPTVSYQEFIFPMRDALIERIVARFNAQPWTPLTPGDVDHAFPEGNDRQFRGVYLLGQSIDNTVHLKYVGQSEEAVYKRLKRHANFVQDRHGLPAGSVFFKGLGVVIFDSVSLESGLIDEYGDQVRWRNSNSLSGWNMGGLGSNDTGGGRDRQKPSGFDRRFPIDITIQKHNLLDAGTTTVKQFFLELSSRLPYTVRLPNALRDHPDILSNISVDEGVVNTNLRSALELLLDVLPVTWSVKVFPGRVVLVHNETHPTGSLVNPVDWPPQRWLDSTVSECPIAVLRRPT
jgi:hypothetical protein